jgi:hypothetical protein
VGEDLKLSEVVGGKRVLEGEIVFVFIFVRKVVALDSLQSAKLIVVGGRRWWRWQGTRGARLARSAIFIVTTDLF